VQLHGAAATLATRCGVERLHVSLTHTQLSAAAFVIATSTPEHPRAG